MSETLVKCAEAFRKHVDVVIDETVVKVGQSFIDAGNSSVEKRATVEAG